MVTYTSATLVAELLQLTTFTSTSSPTFTQVEKIISRKEARINLKLSHAWREETVTDLFLNDPTLTSRDGVSFNLPNYSIRSLNSGSGDKIEVWRGSEYVDYLAT